MLISFLPLSGEGELACLLDPPLLPTERPPLLVTCPVFPFPDKFPPFPKASWILVDQILCSFVLEEEVIQEKFREVAVWRDGEQRSRQQHIWHWVRNPSWVSSLHLRSRPKLYQ